MERNHSRGGWLGLPWWRELHDRVPSCVPKLPNWANCPPTGLPLDEGHDPLSPPDLDSWGFLENPENGRKEVKLMGEMRKVLTESLGKSVGQSSIQAAECAGSLLGILPGKPLYRGLCCIDVNVRQG
ncbi:hypothetical protein MCOR04_009336 [Pyricularia oryzae]|nr:hypothetical protein MCOR05_003175 [Pyricularia oryzae]KAI6562604.1 hypothetical protein MCOR04_009336 [Pyricularia oryzae]